MQDKDESGNDPSVTFSFTQSPVQTRVEMGEDGRGSFADGDKIDLYARSSSGTKHFLLTMVDGQWEPQILRSQLGKGDVVLTGYYPATEPAQSPNREYCHAVAADQRTDRDFSASDLLRGSVRLADGKTLVRISFAHAMHRLRINVKPQAGGSLPDDLQVEVLSKRFGTVSEDGTMEVEAGAEPEWLTAHTMKEGWAAILFPQPTEPYRLQGWIRLSSGGKNSLFNLPDEISGKPFTRFEAGLEVTINLTLASQGGGGEGAYTLTFDPTGGEGTVAPLHLEPGETVSLPDGAEHFTKPNCRFVGWNSSPDKGGIVDWAAGQSFTMPAHDMTIYAVWRILDTNIGGACEEFKGTTQWLQGLSQPAPEEWIQVKGWAVTDGVEGKTVPARQTSKWYDVSQGYLSMCWAAGASDILHYWMDRNADYLARYGYTGPRSYDYKTGASDIFNAFLPHWNHDNGGFAQAGFSWFLEGNESKSGGGYFRDVFEGKVAVESVKAASGRRAVSRKNFTEILTRAFKEDMAICMAMPHLGGSHQYIVWGAKYNDEGYVCGLYYVNPNDFDQHTVTNEPLGLLYMDVFYLEDGGAYVASSMPGSYIPILSMAVCGIGRDVWEEYFDAHPDKSRTGASSVE